MLIWFLKLSIISLNIRSSHKALTRQTRSSRSNGSRSATVAVPRRKRLRGSMTNWIVWIVFLALEKVADKVIDWVPFYTTLKAFVLLVLLLARETGAQIAFDKFIRPAVKPWEPTLDFVTFVVSEVVEITLFCLLILPRWVATRWRKYRSVEPDVPSILRGLRQQHPVPRVAESLAQSLERSQGQADQINERLSQPVTIRLNPVQASKRQLLSTAVTVPQRPMPPNSLPPAAFSTAPFRPIKPPLPPTAVSATTATKQRPVASTSRLPVASSSRISTSSGSIYPSLESLPPVPTTLPSNNHVGHPPSHPKTDSHSRPAIRNAPPSPPVGPPNTSRRSSSTINPDLVSTSLSTPPGSIRDSSARTIPSIVPPTPAPPGAFHLDASTPRPRGSSPLSSRASVINEVEMQVEESSREESQETSKRSTTNRRKAKRSIATVVNSDDEADTQKEEIVTPRRKKLKSSPVVDKKAMDSIITNTPSKDTSAQIASKRKALDSNTESKTAAATPRQRALGAISQLAIDLDDENEVGGSPSPKKRTKLGVLARSSSSSTNRVMTSIKTRATRSTPVEEPVADEGEAEQIAPRQRKARRVPLTETHAEHEEAPAVTTINQRKVPTAVASRTTIAKAVPSTRTSRLQAQPSRATAGSRTSSRAPSPQHAQEQESQPIVATSAPKRKTRVLLGRRPGSIEVEDEIEIEGVAVVAGRRRR
ncbi:uncharacterized protein JCM15063_005784 [Sporobolomyces koalae]|uniref:uncharacterized protein n=1 Tax=Sporobolomyces koalae TaxID=500713 RepID=UPI0031739B99